MKLWRVVVGRMDGAFALWLVLLTLFFLLRFTFVFWQANGEAIRRFFH
jgi:cbb3-type cytochrome oxidase subunit 3